MAGAGELTGSHKRGVIAANELQRRKNRRHIPQSLEGMNGIFQSVDPG